MKTVYRIVDENGKEFNNSQLTPYVRHDVNMVSVEYRPNTDPEDPSEDEMIVTLEYVFSG